MYADVLASMHKQTYTMCGLSFFSPAAAVDTRAQDIRVEVNELLHTPWSFCASHRPIKYCAVIQFAGRIHGRLLCSASNDEYGVRA